MYFILYFSEASSVLSTSSQDQQPPLPSTSPAKSATTTAMPHVKTLSSSKLTQMTIPEEESDELSNTSAINNTTNVQEQAILEEGTVTTETLNNTKGENIETSSNQVVAEETVKTVTDKIEVKIEGIQTDSETKEQGDRDSNTDSSNKQEVDTSQNSPVKPGEMII